MFTIYVTEVSSNARKVLAVCRQLELEPSIERVEVYAGEGRRPEFLALNPQGKVPVLVEGELVLWESNAILGYLAEVHGNYQLSSRDPAVRADIARWLFWEAAHWQPALTLVLTPFAGYRLAPAYFEPPTEPPAWDHPKLAPLLAQLDAHLRGREFLVNRELTIADFGVAGMSTYFGAAGFPFGRYPHLSTWCERIEGLEAWAATESDLWRA